MNEDHQLEFGLNEERTELQLRLVANEQELFRTGLEAPELDDLIALLGKYREQLVDAVSPQLEEGARLANTVRYPSFLIGKNTEKGEALLAFRHPGFGWLGFQLRRDRIAAIIEQLARWLNEPGKD